jgi:hypothetical protein
MRLAISILVNLPLLEDTEDSELHHESKERAGLEWQEYSSQALHRWLAWT